MSLVRFIAGYVKLNIATAMEYRFNFILQSLFMFLNNSFFIVFWYFLFQQVDVLNGWAFQDAVMLFGMASLSFGFAAFFLGNWHNIHEIIRDGKFDFFLALPKNELLHVLISKNNFSGFGDLLFGLVAYFVFVPFSFGSFLLFLFLGACGSAIWLSLMILVDSLSFVYENVEGIHEIVRQFIFAFTTYPNTLFSGFLKMFLFFVFPVFFITNVPVMLLKEFNILYFLLLIGIAILLPLLAHWAFKLGVRRYESGNLFNTRM